MQLVLHVASYAESQEMGNFKHIVFFKQREEDYSFFVTVSTTNQSQHAISYFDAQICPLPALC